MRKKKNIQELAFAPLAPFVIPAAAAALGATGLIMQAKKQGQGGRSQPSPDYGQSGEGARPRTPNVQRGRLDPNEVYKRRMKELRRQDAQARSQEKAEKGIERLIGTDAERAEAARARANQAQIQRRLSQRNRMSRAAENIPPEHRTESYTLGKTFQQFREAAGDKFAKMTDQQFRDWQRSNPGAADKAKQLRDAARSATPRPTGSGPQLPNVPKPQPTAQQPARWNRGQRFTDPRAQQVYDRMNQQSATRFAPKPPTVAAPAAGMGARVLPALGRAAVGAVARHPIGAAAVMTGLGAYGAYKLATSMNQRSRAPQK